MTPINGLNKKYDLELEKVVSEIQKKKCKLVLLQFPDGLKPYATAVVDYLEEKLAPKGVSHRGGPGEGGTSSSSSPSVKGEINTECKFLIWLGDCFGACDTPILGEDLEKEIDLIVQFGHNSLQPTH